MFLSISQNMLKLGEKFMEEIFISTNSFLTLKEEAHFEQEIKKSKFIAHCKPVKTVDEAEEFIKQEWDRFPDATHIVFGYKVGKEVGGQINSRLSDNGEPQGTSGPPVYDVIDKGDIFDAIITVTRYYGGTLLGTGGLVKAYGSSASEVVKVSGLVQMVPGREVTINIPYKFIDNFNYRLDLIPDMVNVLEHEYSTNIKISCIVDIVYEDEFYELIRELSQGQAYYEKGDLTYQAKDLKEQTEDATE